MIDQLLRSDGYDILVVGGHEYELGEFFRFLPHELRGRVAGTFSAHPVATPMAEIRSSAEGVMRRYRHEQDQRLVAHVLELAAAGGLAAVGPEDCLWAGSMSAIDTLLLRDGATLVGVACDESRWLAASGDICPVCGKHTRYARTSWTSSRQPSSRSAARPGRSRRTSCQTSTRRRRSFGSRLHREGQAAEGRRQPAMSTDALQARRGRPDPLPGDGRRAAAPRWPSSGTSGRLRPRPPG